MNSEHSSSGFIDPNARLLASVVPPPPPTLRAKVAGFVSTRSAGDVRRMVRWARSREGRSCFIAALAGVALTLGFYRSEASSAASAGPVLAPLAGREATAVVGAPSLRSEPRALTPTSTAASGPEPARAAAIATSAAIASDAVADTPSEAALDDGDGTERPSPRKAAASKAHGKKATKAARKAKRQSVAKRSSRNARRAKARRATSAGPLAAWLATQRSKEASASKLR